MSTHEMDIINEFFNLSRFMHSQLVDSKLTMIQLRTLFYIQKQNRQTNGNCDLLLNYTS
jgi:hypothetical protein